MGEDPDAIRRQIELTRADMDRTVSAIGYRTDVKSRARESVSRRGQSLLARIRGATPDTGEVKQGARQAVGIDQENPLGLAIGSVAVGFVAGLLAPSTRVEDEKVGAVADQVKEKAMEVGEEALDRGKQVAQEAADTARQTVQESGPQHGQDLRSMVQEKAQELTPQNPPPPR